MKTVKFDNIYKFDNISSQMKRGACAISIIKEAISMNMFDAETCANALACVDDYISIISDSMGENVFEFLKASGCAND